jgi:hypothetical protein
MTLCRCFTATFSKCAKVGDSPNWLLNHLPPIITVKIVLPLAEGKMHVSKMPPRIGVDATALDGTRKPKASAGTTSWPAYSMLTTATVTKGIADRCEDSCGRLWRVSLAEAKAGEDRNTVQNKTTV